MLPFINPLPILLTFTAAFGVLFHDTQFDHAATTALAAPVIISDFGSAETALRLDEGSHTHTERGSVASSQPSTAPRVLEDKKYIVNRKFLTNFGTDYQGPAM